MPVNLQTLPFTPCTFSVILDFSLIIVMSLSCLCSWIMIISRLFLFRFRQILIDLNFAILLKAKILSKFQINQRGHVSIFLCLQPSNKFSGLLKCGIALTICSICNFNENTPTHHGTCSSIIRNFTWKAYSSKTSNWKSFSISAEFSLRSSRLVS